MKVLVQATYMFEVEVEIPDGLSDDDAQIEATRALDKVSNNELFSQPDYISATFFKEDPDSETGFEEDEWFDTD